MLGITDATSPKGALGLPDQSNPINNPITVHKVELGRKLFMDRRLSPNNTISCAMCHVPEQAFTSNELATAIGIEGKSNKRNSPTILNVAYYKELFHDGREHSLEKQVIGPLTTANEMGNPSLNSVVEKIRRLRDYEGMFERAFGKSVDEENITIAIAAYEKTLISANSRFDRYVFGNEVTAMNRDEVNGFKLFMGKAHCVTCHAVEKTTAIFTDQRFHNTGIGYKSNTLKATKPTMQVTLAPGITVQTPSDHFEKASEIPLEDHGRFEITKNSLERWAYKTPSLRNVALTGPYMHDGSLLSLEAVVEFYDAGGINNPLKDKLILPLKLTPREKKDLVAFLNTLTGDNVLSLAQEARDAYSEPN